MENREDFRAYHYETVGTLRTRKTEYMDLGAGLSILSFLSILFLILNKVKNWSDVWKIIPVGGIHLWILINVTWLMTIPGTYWYYTFRGGRGDYPWFANSIGIPIYENVLFSLIALIPLNVLFGIGLWCGTYPAKLFSRERPHKSWWLAVEVFFLITLLGLIFVLAELTIDGDHFSIPVFMVLIYSVLSIRGAVIQRLSLTGMKSSASSPS